MLYPRRGIEVKLVLFSFSLVSDIQRIFVDFCLILGRCIIIQSESEGMRCLNEKRKDCKLNQTWQMEVLPLDNASQLLFLFSGLSMAFLILSISSVVWSGCLMASALNFIFFCLVSIRNILHLKLLKRQ